MLTVRDLAISVNGAELVSFVDFIVPTGQCLGLVGETGSGKSLTCRALTGLLPAIGGTASRGSILLDDDDLANRSQKQWRALRGRDIAFIPQNSMSGLDPLMRVGRQLAETVAAISPGVDPRRRALELLDQVRMPRAAEIMQAHPHELSGGMRQRVMIAMAIVGQPRLLVADEPTTALDVTVQKEILTLLTSLRSELGMTMVFVTHDLGVVAEISSSLAIMYAGMTVEFGATEKVLTNPDHPYTMALLRAHPSSARVGNSLSSIGGSPPAPSNWPSGCRFAPRCPYSVTACTVAVPPPIPVGDGRLSRCIHPQAAGVTMEHAR